MNGVEISPIVITVDLETLGRGERAVIGTIGAVARNVVSGKELGTFYTRIDLTLDQPGRERHEDTLLWWDGLAETQPAAWREMFDPELPRGTLLRALEGLAEFIAMIKAHCRPGSYVQVLGNGPEFDNAILAHAYESHGLAQPWQFRGNQSLRTLVWLGRLLLGIDPKYGASFAGIPHHALDDARHEATTLQTIFDAFRAQGDQAAQLANAHAGIDALRLKLQDLQRQHSQQGLDIDHAILSGTVPAHHPIRDRLLMLANHRQRSLDLAAQLENATRLLRECQASVEYAAWNKNDNERLHVLLGRIDAALAGKASEQVGDINVVDLIVPAGGEA